jgi:hypothetical protein
VTPVRSVEPDVEQLVGMIVDESFPSPPFPLASSGTGVVMGLARRVEKFLIETEGVSGLDTCGWQWRFYKKCRSP